MAPSGVVETEESSKMSHCTWVYTRVDLSKPVLCLPTKDKYTTAVRFSPKLYKLRPVKSGAKNSGAEQPWNQAKSLFALPYRLVYAVATQNAIMFYDSQQVAPFGRVSNVHYTGLTDLTWSTCGNILFASSSDGYCSIVTFEPGEIGEYYEEATSEAESQTEESVKTDKKASGKAKKLQFVTLSSPKGKKTKKVVERSGGQEKLEINLTEDQDNLGVERMETDDHEDGMKLVLEDTEQEPPTLPSASAPPALVSAPPAPASAPVKVDSKKRVPLTTLVTPANLKPSPSATPEKAKKRVNLITLSSPKTKP